MSLLATSESFLFLFSFNNNDKKYAVHQAKKCVEISIIVITSQCCQQHLQILEYQQLLVSVAHLPLSSQLLKVLST